MESKNKSKNKAKYFVIVGLLLIPFISIFLIIEIRHKIIPTNKEIIEAVVNSNSYKTEAEYTIINSKGEFNEGTKIYYKKNYGFRVEFEQDRVKLYKDGYISIKENDYEYELNEGFDSFYPLGFINNILSNDVTEINEGSEEWGEIKYLEVDVNLHSKNKHLSKAKVYINKEDKSPIVTKIFDSNGEESVIILYKNFNYLKKIDKNLF